MEHKQSSQDMINERRDYFRIDDTVLLRYLPIDKTSALANIVPRRFSENPSYSLVRELQLIEQENSKFLRAIAEENRDLEAYLKSINKKIELIAGKLMEGEDESSDQQKTHITMSEGGLSFHAVNEHADDSYLALQITFLPSHQPIIVFTKVINCTQHGNDYIVALSFVNLKDTERHIIAKHIMQIQLAQRRQQMPPEGRQLPARNGE